MLGYDNELAEAWLRTHAGLSGIVDRQAREEGGRLVLGGDRLVCQVGSGLPLFYEYPNPAVEGMEGTAQFFAKVRAAGAMEGFRKEADLAGEGVGGPMPPDAAGLKEEMPVAVGGPRDPWMGRSTGMRCRTCVFFVEKDPVMGYSTPRVGRCRRHAPAMGGFPVVYLADWCGDHRLDETKV